MAKKLDIICEWLPTQKHVVFHTTLTRCLPVSVNETLPLFIILRDATTVNATTQLFVCCCWDEHLHI